ARQRANVSSGNEMRQASGYRWRITVVIGDNAATAAQGLNDRNAEALMVRRQHEHIRLAENSLLFRLRSISVNVHFEPGSKSSLHRPHAKPGVRYHRLIREVQVAYQV